jgi:hypothetical protein
VSRRTNRLFSILSTALIIAGGLILTSFTAHATAEDCLAHLETAGFLPTGPRIDACNAGEQGDQDFCRNLLVWTRIPPSTTTQACRLAEQAL